jgi:hypothetical protein
MGAGHRRKSSGNTFADAVTALTGGAKPGALAVVTVPPASLSAMHLLQLQQRAEAPLLLHHPGVQAVLAYLRRVMGISLPAWDAMHARLGLLPTATPLELIVQKTFFERQNVGKPAAPAAASGVPPTAGVLAGVPELAAQYAAELAAMGGETNSPSPQAGRALPHSPSRRRSLAMGLSLASGAVQPQQPSPPPSPLRARGGSPDGRRHPVFDDPMRVPPRMYSLALTPGDVAAEMEAALAASAGAAAAAAQAARPAAGGSTEAAAGALPSEVPAASTAALFKGKGGYTLDQARVAAGLTDWHSAAGEAHLAAVAAQRLAQRRRVVSGPFSYAAEHV